MNNGTFGLRWREWSKLHAAPVVREKWFRSDDSRHVFAERLLDKDNFCEIVGFAQRVTLH